jgi:hypothetical protein
MQIAKESSQASQVLQSEEKGGVRERRRYQPLALVRTIRLAMLRLQGVYRQKAAQAELACRDRGTPGTIVSRGNPHVGQRGPGSRHL